MFTKLLKRLTVTSPITLRRTSRPLSGFRPTLEALEGRWMLNAGSLLGIDSPIVPNGTETATALTAGSLTGDALPTDSSTLIAGGNETAKAITAGSLTADPTPDSGIGTTT